MCRAQPVCRPNTQPSVKMALTARMRADLQIGCGMKSRQQASQLEKDHPQQLTVNGKNYNWPKAPVVVVLINGGDPAYVHAAFAQGLLPNLKKFMTKGF